MLNSLVSVAALLVLFVLLLMASWCLFCLGAGLIPSMKRAVYDARMARRMRKVPRR